MICIACGHANRTYARFCADCGNRLPGRCHSCEQELPLAARFCDACGVPVAAPAARVAARKVVSVVFGDIVGSTALQETLDPESVRGVMTRFYDAMRAVVSRHDGHLEKFLGDGVVAVFGIPAVGEDDALRAVRCAAAMHTDLVELDTELCRVWGVRLRMRVGVATGELVTSGEGELVGDAMNTAARLEQSAPPGGVLVGESTWRLVRHSVQLEPVAPLELRGKSAPARAWRLLDITPEPGDPESGRLDTPLIGRVAELDRLRAALDDAVASRECRLVTVIGSPGVGKTRLADEFRERVVPGSGVVRGRCEHMGQGITFLPVAEMFRTLGEIGETDSTATIREKLAGLVGETTDADRVVFRASSLLGAADPASGEETFWAVRRVLETLARREPLVVVLDDLHWGQPMFLDLVEHLVEWVRDAPILVVALSRPELREMREALTVPGHRASDVIELAPLSDEQSLEFVEGLLGTCALPPGLLTRVLDTAGGNPLFLGETLRMLVDDGLVDESGDVRTPVGGWAMQVPPTISALLSARVERLQLEERAVIERAAVIGKQFYRSAVADLIGPPLNARIDTHLDALQRKELVEPDGTFWADEPVYRFNNVLIRDAAYRSLLKQARAELHERFADWLSAKAGGTDGAMVGEHEEVSAYHLEQAHGYLRELGPLDERGRSLGSRVASMLHSAGRRALAREDVPAATIMLRRALDRTDGDHPELLWDLAEVLLLAGDTAAAEEIIGRFAAIAGTAAVPRARTDVLNWHLRQLIGDPVPDATIETMSRAASELAAAGDCSAAAEAHHVAARGHRQQGRFGAAELALDRALIAARRAGDRRRVTEALAAVPRATLWGPTPVARASGRCLDVLRIMRMTPGNRHVEPIALRCQAVLEAMRGRFESARKILADGRGMMQDLGQELELCELATHSGIIELLAGDPAAASPHLLAAREGFAGLGVGVSAARATALLARALIEQGEDEAALEATWYAEHSAGGELKATVNWCGVRAEVLARRGEADEAVRLARQAVAVAEGTDALTDKADAWLCLAKVLAMTGADAADVDLAAKAARALYEAKGHTVGAAWTTELTGAPGPVRQRLATALATLGDRAPGRFVARLVRRWATGSSDAVLELYAENFRLVDHSGLGWGEVNGRDDARRMLASVVPKKLDTYLRVTSLLAGDDRVIAFTGVLPGTAPELEVARGFVMVVENGLLTQEHTYRPDDRERMLADYARLGGRPGALGDRPPERAVAALCRPWEPAELDELMELFPETVVRVDHRGAGPTQLDGRELLRREYTAQLETLEYLVLQPDEVLACDDRVLAMRATLRGTGRGSAGTFVTVAGYVIVVADGRIQRLEYYEPDEVSAVLARYVELGGSHKGLGDRPPERLFAEMLRRTAAEESVRDLYHDDFVMVDHRRLGWEDVTGPESMAELMASVYAMAPDMQITIDDMIARDESVMAVATTGYGTAADGGGELVQPVGYVVSARDGRAARIEIYEPEDRAVMVARYAELGGGQGPLGDLLPERVWGELIRRHAARDLVGLGEIIGPDYALVDHRRLGWEEIRGREALLEHLRNGFEVSTDSRMEVDEVLACDDRVIALRVTVHGTNLEDGARFDRPLGIVSLLEDGLIVRRDQYDHHDTSAMLARYAQLGGTRKHLRAVS
jgi:class 3 adenylate cyclase/ketosteroid isomerase-like protein/tetratricopeptide (TPR) repeat protein